MNTTSQADVVRTAYHVPYHVGRGGVVRSLKGERTTSTHLPVPRDVVGPRCVPRTTSLERFGGKYAPAIGTSTRHKSDHEDQLERLADFNAELERCRFGVVAGREW